MPSNGLIWCSTDYIFSLDLLGGNMVKLSFHKLKIGHGLFDESAYRLENIVNLNKVNTEKYSYFEIFTNDLVTYLFFKLCSMLI